MSSRTKVLIVDDSAIVRKVLTEMLSHEPDIEVVGTAPDACIARDKIQRLKPDVLTLDLEMPRLHGLSFLKQLMKESPMPVIVISSIAWPSSEAGIEALKLGAVEVLPKPGGPYSVGDLRERLVHTVRLSSRVRVKAVRPRLPVAPAGTPDVAPAPGHRNGAAKPSIIAIGASTGGVEAITALLRQMPAGSPAMLIVQHIPAVFSESFARRLDQVCAMRVREARQGDEVVPGTALVAPGGVHMALVFSDRLRVRLTSDAPEHFHRPSVDVLFRSVAEVAGPNGMGILLTGMGADGADGLLSMRRAGAATLAQDEASSVVFGMPRRAIEMGAVQHGTSLREIARALASAGN